MFPWQDSRLDCEINVLRTLGKENGNHQEADGFL